MPCLLVMVSALFHVGCGRGHDAMKWQLEREKMELSQSLELAIFRYEQLDFTASAELGRLRDQAGVDAALLVTLRQRHADLAREVTGLEQQRSGFLTAILETRRRQMIGRSFATFVSAAGRTFDEARIAAIDDAGVTIRHAAGSARVPFADLDFEQRILFGLDEELALAAKASEAKQALAYERWIDQRLAVIHDKEENASQVASVAVEAARSKRLRNASRLQASASVRPLGRPASSFGNGSHRSSRSYSSYRTPRSSYRYVYYQQPFCYRASYNQRVAAQCGSVSWPRSPANTHVVPRRQSFAETTVPYIP